MVSGEDGADGVKVYNPAFDVTDNDLIDGIVTEYGIARAPYAESLREIFDRTKNRVKRSEPGRL